MQVLNPQVPSGKGAVRRAAGDFAGALYGAGIVGGAILAAAWIYRTGRAKLVASKQLAASTAQSASGGLQSLLG